MNLFVFVCFFNCHRKYKVLRKSCLLENVIFTNWILCKLLIICFWLVFPSFFEAHAPEVPINRNQIFRFCFYFLKTDWTPKPNYDYETSNIHTEVTWSLRDPSREREDNARTPQNWIFQLNLKGFPGGAEKKQFFSARFCHM